MVERHPGTRPVTIRRTLRALGALVALLASLVAMPAPAGASGTFDLALRHTVSAVDSPLLSTGDVTFELTVTNQGTPVEVIEITDYIDAAQFEAMTISGSVNSSGTAGGTTAATYLYSWSGGGTYEPVVTLSPLIPGLKMQTGETVTVPLTLTVAAGWDGSDLENWAEISKFDDDTIELNGDSSQPGFGSQLFDADSTPDADPVNDAAPAGLDAFGDDAIHGEGGDEDDHDVAGVKINDVSLIKDLAPGQAPDVDGSVADPVARFITVVKNQGNHPLRFVTVTEHLPVGMALDAAQTDAANSALSGLVRNGSTFVISEPLAPGASFTYEVIVSITDPAAGPFVTQAEVSSLAGGRGATVVDVDSVPDATAGNDLVALVTSAGDDNPVNSHDDIDYDRTAGGAPIVTLDDDDDHGQEVVGVIAVGGLTVAPAIAAVAPSVEEMAELVAEPSTEPLAEVATPVQAVPTTTTTTTAPTPAVAESAPVAVTEPAPVSAESAGSAELVSTVEPVTSTSVEPVQAAPTNDVTAAALGAIEERHYVPVYVSGPTPEPKPVADAMAAPGEPNAALVPTVEAIEVGSVAPVGDSDGAGSPLSTLLLLAAAGSLPAAAALRSRRVALAA